jgi:plastocyanin
MRSTRYAWLAVAALVLPAVSSCGGGGSAPNGPTGTPGAVTITILRQNGAQSFSPNPSSAGGQTVVFRNADTVVHRVRLNDGTVDTGDLAPGAISAPVQMPTGGTHYHCPLHAGMVGSVNASGGTPPAECEGVYCDGTY